MKVFADQLQKVHAEHVQWGIECDCEPVDAFGGYVAVDKYAADNLSRTNDNIAWKVGLEPAPSRKFKEEVRHK